MGGTDGRGDGEGWASVPGLAAVVRMRAWGWEGDEDPAGDITPGSGSLPGLHAERPPGSGE